MARNRSNRPREYHERDEGNPLPERVSFEDRAADFPIQVVRRGRRIKLTEELIAAYGRALNQSSQETAAAILGFSVRTINDWISKAREPECEDEMMLLLRDTHDAVMAGGNRLALDALLWEHAVDDPKTAMFLAERRLPGMQVTKLLKADVNVAVSKGPDTSEFENMSPEEILLRDALERATLKRLEGK